MYLFNDSCSLKEKVEKKDKESTKYPKNCTNVHKARGNLDPGDFCHYYATIKTPYIHLIWIAMFPTQQSLANSQWVRSRKCSGYSGVDLEFLVEAWWNHDGKNGGSMMEPAKLVYSDCKFRWF